MAINKFQRSRLAFDFAAKIAYIGVISIYWNIVFSETTRPIKLELHMKTPLVKGIAVCSDGPGHMTKMAAMPIYGNTPLKIFFSRTLKPMTLGLGM